jgi:hypothetical protein
VTGTVLVIAVAFVTPVLATSTPASADTADQLVSGPFSGTTSVQVVGVAGNPQVFDATYTTSAGTGSLSINGSLGLVTFDSFLFAGSFTLTAPDGATLQGTAAGTENILSLPFPPGPASLSIALTPTSGTNEFAGFTTVINLTGTLVAMQSACCYFGPISGSLLSSALGLPTTTTLVSSQNPSQVGQAVTYTAIVSPATLPAGGIVIFTDNGEPMAGCMGVSISGASATCTTTPLAPGAHNIVATFIGAGDFLGSTSPPLTQDVLSPPPLPCTKLQGCNLSGFNLSYTNLSGADLQGANLMGANLTGADLSGANLQGDNLMGANLSGAFLSSANLKDTNLSNVTWSNTNCPDGTNSDNDGGTCVGHL